MKTTGAAPSFPVSNFGGRGGEGGVEGVGVGGSKDDLFSILYTRERLFAFSVFTLVRVTEYTGCGNTDFSGLKARVLH
jgi:hypothetical protein